MSDPKEDDPTTEKPVANDPSKIKPRLVAITQLYHQRPQQQPKAVTSSFTRQLETHEQVYQRELIATEEWQPILDKACWLDECSLVEVENDEGKHLAVNPTEEEREATAAKVLEITFCSDALLTDQPDEPVARLSWLIPPGEAFHGTPSHPKALFIRSQSGETRFTLTVFPR